MQSLVQFDELAERRAGSSRYRSLSGWSRIRGIIISVFGLLALTIIGIGSASAAVCGTTTWKLTAGQTIVVGSVTVANDQDFIYVTYELTYPDATFGNLHLWIGTDIANVPAGGGGNPAPGQFPYHHDATGQTKYTFVIPWSDTSLPDIPKLCGAQLVIVAHAEVKNVNGKSETAFGGDTKGNIDKGRWYFYGTYTVCCDEEPPVYGSCETAFAKPDREEAWVFTTDSKSNPEGLPTLKLTKNRWGWAAKIGSSPKQETYDLWAGAGLNNTSKGTFVGILTVDWNKPVVQVTYSLIKGFVLRELHVYADDAKPSTIAPGQYGTTEYFMPPVKERTVTLSVEDAANDGFWLIAHAVVCEVVK